MARQFIPCSRKGNSLRGKKFSAQVSKDDTLPRKPTLLNLSINCAITGASWRAHILMDMKVLQFMTNPFHKIIVHTGRNNILICISHCLNILFCSMSKDHSQVRSIVTAALEICLQDFQSIASKRIWEKKYPQPDKSQSRAQE